MRQDLKQRLQALMDKCGPRRGQVASLIRFLGYNTEFLTAPASHRYHMNQEEGLLEHSLNVAENLLKIKECLFPEISDESCVIVGLFHDLGKGGSPGHPYYVEKEPTPKQKAAGYKATPPYVYNEDIVKMHVPFRSLYHVMRHIEISETEAQAIMCHDGQYVPENKFVACNEEPLTLLVHYADSWSGFVIEKSKGDRDKGIVYKTGEEESAVKLEE